MQIKINSLNNIKRITILLFFITLVCITSCGIQKEVRYEMPTGLSEINKKQFIQFFDQGEKIYGTSCANCHNKKVDKKIVIPVFTEEQLELYTIRINNEQHSMKLSTRDLSDENLQKVVFFLKYKKKNLQ